MAEKKTEKAKKVEKKGPVKTRADHPPRPSTLAHHIPHHGDHIQKITVNVYSVDGKAKGKVTLPQVFNEEYRPDLIRRAVSAARANRRQPYGPSPTSGMRRSVYWSGKGRGVSRVPRLMNSMRGAQAPNTVGGRPGWGPDIRRDWSKKMNQKEKRKAVFSALRAVREKEIVKHRGHRFDGELSLPVVIEDRAESISTTKEIIALLEGIGVYEDIQRSKQSTHVRAGHGKMRNRPYRERKSVLIVAGKAGEMAKGAGNLPGFDITTPERLNTELLAPGGDPGRLTLFTESALEAMRKW